MMDNQLYKRCLFALVVACFGLGSYFNIATSFSTEKVINIDIENKTEEEEETVLSYPIVDTGQNKYYDNSKSIQAPKEGQAFYGQDAMYVNYEASYTDNGDGTITDNVTGLMWQQDPGDKVSYNQGTERANVSTLAGYDDWRVPTIKELYSLMNFNGKTGKDMSSTIPYIDDTYFNFKAGNVGDGERFIDGQYMTQTIYVSTTMNGDKTMFGVNFVDGRIKGYPVSGRRPGEEKTYYLLMVRGNEAYGENTYVDNGDGTITDTATGLMWLQNDSGTSMSWQEALGYAEQMEYAGYDDWKLPDAKELQSIVDYTRSPQTTHSAAIDPLFNASTIMDEGGSANYPFYWTSTTHLDGPRAGESAVYVSFGEALGFMTFPRQEGKTLIDVHGAGAQRSDPKTGEASDYPYGFGPQGDVRRIDNYVRLVRHVTE